MTEWFYLSFASDDGWLGGVVVRGTDVIEAAREAHRRGVNPGGEALGLPLDEHELPPEEFRNILLSQADVKSWDGWFSGGEGEALAVEVGEDHIRAIE